MKSRCKECDEVLIGRSDKKFCNDYCRSAYHSRLKRPQNNFMRRVNAVLARNRHTLAKLYESKGSQISKSELSLSEFNFSYATQWVQQNDLLIQCCYDFALYLREDEECLIKPLDEHSTTSVQN